jgi:hypothetical protein
MTDWDFAGEPVARALLARLVDAGSDGERIDELPPNLREIDTLDLMDGARLIEFGSRNHCRDGAGRLILENGYRWAHWAKREGFLPLEEFLPDLLRGESDLRPLVRLTAAGRHEAKKLKQKSLLPSPAKSNGDTERQSDPAWVKKLSTDSRLALLYKNTPEATEWTAKQVADAFGVDESTVRKCKIWTANRQRIKGARNEKRLRKT